MMTRIVQVAAGAVVLAWLAACGGSTTVGSTDGSGDPTVAEGDGGVSVDSGAMCVDLYSARTLAEREVAFDGTVKAVADDEVTFEVNEWFTGGDAGEITLEGALGLGGISSVGDAQIEVASGERLLVSGDGGFAWACGFTKPYSAETAAEWRAATSE